jgi:hypothetical protein
MPQTGPPQAQPQPQPQALQAPQAGAAPTAPELAPTDPAEQAAKAELEAGASQLGFEVGQVRAFLEANVLGRPAQSWQELAQAGRTYAASQGATP